MLNEHEKLAHDAVTKLVERAHKDPEFAKKAKADPVGTLVAAGIPRPQADALIRPSRICTDTTCWSSGCPGTCYVTVYTLERN